MQKFASFFGPQDLTKGKPFSGILRFSVPLLIGNVAQLLYSTVDSIIVGHYIGDNALASIGASGPIINLMLVLFMGIATGTGIMVSQYFGGKQLEKLSDTVGTAITLTAASSILISIISLIITRPLLNLTGTPVEIFEMSASYMRILMGGLICTGMYNILSGILRGLGDSFMPLLFLIFASLVNVVLDIVFVASFGWGVAGAAYATIISQFLSAILCLIRLRRMRHLVTLTVKKLRPNMPLLKQMMKLGMPSGATQAIFSMAMIFVQALVNTFGPTVIAVATVVMRVDSFAMIPNFSFGFAMTTFSGQNIGAGQIERVAQGTKSGLKLAVLTSLVLTILLVFFGRALIVMFTSTEEVIRMSQNVLRILAAGYIAMAIMQTLSGVMRGAGDTMTPMWISLFATVGMRVPIAYLLVHLSKTAEMPLGSPYWIYVSLLISWCTSAALNTFFFKKGKWRTKGLNRGGKTDPVVDVEGL